MFTRLLPALLLTTSLCAADSLPEGAKARLGSTRFRHGGPIQHIALSPDGKLLATSGMDRVIRLWDAGTGRPVVSCEVAPVPASYLAFSPDGKSLAALHQYQGVRVWDAATGKVRWAL